MKPALPEDMRLKLEVVSSVLARCFIFALLAQLFSFLVALLMDDTIYRIYTMMFEITRSEFDLFLLYTYAFIKVLNVVFFLIPWLAIKHLLSSRKVAVP
jgi:hypothetical protein